MPDEENECEMYRGNKAHHIWSSLEGVACVVPHTNVLVAANEVLAGLIRNVLESLPSYA